MKSGEPSCDDTTRIWCNHTFSSEISPVSGQARLSEFNSKTTSYYVDFLSFLSSSLLCPIVLRPVSEDLSHHNIKKVYPNSSHQSPLQPQSSAFQTPQTHPAVITFPAPTIKYIEQAIPATHNTVLIQLLL